MNKIKVGVAGVGAIGRNHARTYAALEGAELAAVFDTDLARAEEVANEVGCPAVSSLEEFAKLVDAATVSTPTNTHLEVGSALLSADKDLLIEKTDCREHR